MTIAEQIQEEIQNSKISLDAFPEFADKQHLVISLIDDYWVSKYRDGERDSLGLKKCFYNVNNYPTEVASKMIDFDTKDIRLTAEEGHSYYPSWYFKKELDFWLKDNQIAKLFNQIIYSLPKYGSVVLKKARDGIYIVPLQNITIVDPSVDSLEKTPIIERHEMTPAQLADTNWQNVEEAIDKFGENGKIEIHERSSPFCRCYDVVAGIDDGVGVEVHHEENRDPPYKEVHWERVPGRWLGRGQVEKLFESQIYQNQIANYKRQGLYWTSKHIYQSRDDNVSRNLLTEVDNGDILRVNDEIQPIVNEERNLHAYREDEERWDALQDKLTFSYDVIRGERTPAGTPLGSAILQSRMAGGFFDLKREDIGIFLKEVLWDWVLPKFKNQKSDQHIMNLLGNEDDIENYDNLMVNYKLNEELTDFVAQNNYVPTRFQIETMKTKITEGIKSSDQRFLQIPAKFYNDLKYKLDVVITGEQVNMSAKLQTLQTIFQILGSNPTILKDKMTRKFFYKMIDLAGISPAEFQQVETTPSPEEIATKQTAERGGSLAKVPPIAPTAAAPTRARV